MKKEIRPIIKWTGGKFSEFSLFANSIPTFNRYIEPFFGGGGVFFALQPNNAFINDKSTDLINFYRQVGNPLFRQELDRYADAWEQLGSLSRNLWIICEASYTAYIDGREELNHFTDGLTSGLEKELEKWSLFCKIEFVVDASAFRKKLVDSMIDKAKRIRKICLSEKRVFDHYELNNHFETGIKGGAYLHFRSILNAQRLGVLELSTPKDVANWYFVRELCYGSMFRFNSRGGFNIPYGGISYNKKNLRQKVAHLFSKPIVSLFRKATISNLDFEVFLASLDLNEGDFIFVDPPYDSEFSEYDRNAFSQTDQKRLANFLIAIEAKWMVVIKETDFIRQIYTHHTVNIKTFYKNYAYNVRGRNNRGVKHLIITNY